MKKNPRTEQITIRLTESERNKLDELSNIYDCTMTELISDWISSAYDELHNNEDLKDLVNQLMSVKSAIEKINNK